MTASDDPPIWRYMDLSRYVTLLSRGLFFAQPRAFSDPWEGSWGSLAVQRFREKHVDLPHERLQAAWNEHYAAKTEIINSFGISCWHESEEESAALWALYMPQGQGVAVRSTTSRVLSSLSRSSRELSSRRVLYQEEPVDDTPLSLLAYKRPAFAYERELRFFTQLRPDELAAIKLFSDTVKERQQRHAATGTPRPLVRALGGFASNDDTIMDRAAPGGVHLPTEAELLIGEVVLAPQVPYQLRRAVIDATVAFDLPRALIKESSIDQVPRDKVLFHEPAATPRL